MSGQSARPENVIAFPVDDRLCVALYAASRAMTARYRGILAPFELTYPQYLVMAVLWEDGSHLVGTLADRLSLDASTISPVLKRLEALELVVRQRDPQDERRVIVMLTAAGERLEHEAALVPQEVTAASRLTPVQTERLVRQLKRLTASLLAS